MNVINTTYFFEKNELKMMYKWYYLVIVLEEVFVFEHYIVSTALL